MNGFEVAAIALLAGFVPLGIVCLTSHVIDAVVALELAGSVLVMVLICLAAGFDRSVYFNLPVICALVVWVNGLIFVRFLGRFL